MAIFNSLGSNYSWPYAWSNLFAGSNSKAAKDLRDKLSSKYGGPVALTYKGREALELAMINSGLPNDSEVGINGFTCYVVYLAVKNAGYRPVFIDIASEQTNFGIGELQKVHAEHPNLRAIIIQNTLGYPVEMTTVSYAKQHNLMVIEDLAHSIGAVYDDGHEAGTIGSFTMLSFSQDKTIDVVAGGAVIDRRGTNLPLQADLTKISTWQSLKNRCYPVWTGLIRTTYPFGLGRLLHKILKQLKLLSTPMSDDLNGLHVMSNATAGLLSQRLENQPNILAHRREIAEIYQQQLPLEFQIIHKSIGHASYLRFPILVEDRASLVEFLRSRQIYIGDTWYDAPVGPKKYMSLTDYRISSCPNAEKLAVSIVNLPTHQYVTPEVANSICAKIKLWQSSQQKQ